jgi:hypothetical protein
MGIDIYASWRGQTEAERDAQITGFSVLHGHVGYLREAYHGQPYATHLLVPEAFDDTSEEGARIPAVTLRERLPATLKLARERQVRVYNEKPFSAETKRVLKSFSDFVALCERKERETGEPCRISASY